jgi:hypothetical protein
MDGILCNIRLQPVSPVQFKLSSLEYSCPASPAWCSHGLKEQPLCQNVPQPGGACL